MKKKLLWAISLAPIVFIGFVYILLRSLDTTQSVTFPPLVSGDVDYVVGSSTKPLTQEQLKVVAEWLERHRDGWEPVLYTPPPCEGGLILKHLNGQVSSVCFLNKRMIWLTTHKKDSDSKSSDFIGGIQTFSNQDIKPLLDLIKN